MVDVVVGTVGVVGAFVNVIGIVANGLVWSVVVVSGASIVTAVL